MHLFKGEASLACAAVIKTLRHRTGTLYCQNAFVLLTKYISLEKFYIFKGKQIVSKIYTLICLRWGNN